MDEGAAAASGREEVGVVTNVSGFDQDAMGATAVW